MDKIKKHNQIIAAAKAGMNVKTARKYLRIGKLPSELKKVRKYRTRKEVLSHLLYGNRGCDING